MDIMAQHENPIVFISYSQDTVAFADKVLAFSNRLRSEGIDAILDQYEEAPPEGWPRWMENSINKADYVIVVGSKGYYDKIYGNVDQGKGRGVKWEGNLIYQKLYTFNKKYKFENFIVGNSNKYVYFACKGVAENPSAKINPLFIYGGSGLGKTHLLNAIGNSLNELHPELRTLYCTCEKFTGDYVKSLQGNYNAKNNFKEKYRNLDVLIIDDIQFISKAESTQEEFFFTFNELYESGKQIIIASDRPPKEISTLQERLASRFSMGLIQDIQFPDYETRLAILMKKAQEEGFVVEDQVLEYLAEHFDTNIREMEGVLMKVWYYASLIGKKSASMDDAREALKDHDFSNKQNLTAERIIDCVCKYYNVKKDDLLGKKKNKDIVEPRQICMYVICSMLEMSLLSIGQLFGRDHTTVIHARDKVTTAIEENQRVKIAVNDIKAMATKN